MVLRKNKKSAIDRQIKDLDREIARLNREIKTVSRVRGSGGLHDARLNPAWAGRRYSAKTSRARSPAVGAPNGKGSDTAAAGWTETRPVDGEDRSEPAPEQSSNTRYDDFGTAHGRDKFVNYFAAHLHDLRPMRPDDGVLRNKAIMMAILAALAAFGLLFHFLGR